MNGETEAPPSGSLRVRAMTEDDIPDVMEIDRLSFPNPWPESAFHFELRENRAARLLVLDEGAAAPRAIGFLGYWLVEDEAHISTFAVHPERRGGGLGRHLLRAMMEQAGAEGMRTVTLEVRRGNEAAQTLYRSLGFSPVGVRKNYYRDNGEDALLMTASWPPVDGPDRIGHQPEFRHQGRMA